VSGPAQPDHPVDTAATEGPRLGTAILLWVAAVLYLLLGFNLTLDWVDEGFLMYHSWRTAGGAVPHRDFRSMYGPSAFFLNGALLRVFGPELLVVRLWFVAVKATVALLVYLLARRVAGRAAALLVYVLLLAVWGAPFAAVNSPYPQVYVFVFTLAGLLGFTALKRAPLACATAGGCFGAAMTFKHPPAVFAFMAMAWTLIAARGVHASGVGERSARLLRVAVLIGSLALCVGYVVHNVDLWTWLVILTPSIVSIGLLANRERRAPPSPADQRRSVRGVVAGVVAMAVPLLAYGALYWWLGGLRDLLFDMSGLLQRFNWFTPFPAPRPDPSAIGAVLLVGLGLVAARRASDPDLVARAGAGYWLSLALSAAALAYVIWTTVRPGATWAASVLVWMPVAAVWAGLAQVFAPPAVPAAPHRTATAAVTFFGTASLLQLSPAADLVHFAQTLPAFLPVLACGLDRWCRPPPRGASSRWVPRLLLLFLVGALAAGTAWPFVRLLMANRAVRPAASALERAHGIEAPTPADAAAVVAHLTGPALRDRPVFAMTNGMMLYFLTGRRSPVDMDEWWLYMIANNLITESDARAVVDQEALVARLRAARPLIVDYTAGASRLRSGLPVLAQFVDQHYRPVATFGTLRVLDVAGDGSGSG